MGDVSSGSLQLLIIKSTILTVLNKSEKVFAYIMENVDWVPRLSLLLHPSLSFQLLALLLLCEFFLRKDSPPSHSAKTAAAA